MCAALHGAHVVGKRENGFVVFVVVLHGDLAGSVVFLAGDVDYVLVQEVGMLFGV